MRTAWDVDVVSDSDSRAAWAAAFTPQLSSDVAVRATVRSLQDRQTLADVIAGLADTNSRVVVLACAGDTVQALLHGLARAWDGRGTRPVVIAGYPELSREDVVDRLLLRAGADIVLANSAEEVRRFREVFEAVGVDADSVVQTALPFLSGAHHDPAAAGRDRPFTVAFVTHPEVLKTRADRGYAFRQVVEHAVRHPNRLLVVTAREATGRFPDNVTFDLGPLSGVLDRTDLCVTVNPTAAAQAIHRNIPTAVLTDFGVGESQGNSIFLGSNALTSWPALHAGAVPRTDADWAERNGLREADPYGAMTRRVAELTNPDFRLPQLRPWYCVDDSPYYLSGLLMRHGAELAGVPLPAVPGLPGPVSLPRRAFRGSARRMYHVGVRVLEPRIKRWAQL